MPKSLLEQLSDIVGNNAALACCIACMLMATTATANAQPLYRWKDQYGSTYVSDQPPPESCTSADCRAYREDVDKKTREVKRATEEANKAAAEKKARANKIAEEINNLQSLTAEELLKLHNDLKKMSRDELEKILEKSALDPNIKRPDYFKISQGDLKKCASRAGNCALSEIKRHIKNVATMGPSIGSVQFGREYIKEILGSPLREQLIGKNTTYWYYQMNGSTIQIVWDDDRFDGVNIY